MEERRGYRGIVSHVYDDNLHVVVREDFLATKLRSRVLVYSREVSRHASMEEARPEVSSIWSNWRKKRCR
jgi:hypothetical protein